MGSPGKRGWRLARLAAMSPAEIRWRVAAEARSLWESSRAGWERYRPLAAPRGRTLREEMARGLRPLVPPDAWRRRLAHVFPRYLARLGGRAGDAADGRVALFAQTFELGSPPDWHTDPATHGRFRVRAARALDLQDSARVGSVRRVWELNRHHHLTEAALWAWATRDREVGAAVVAQLLDWCAHNPPLVGVHWTSSLELGLRTLAWAEILALLVDAGEPSLDDAALALLAGAWVRQVEHVRAHDSRHSSANNHRIGEAVAVAVAGLALPFHPRAAGWRSWGRETLETELLLQIAPDGAGREQAFAYQRFVLDLAVLAAVMARGHGQDLSDAAHQRLHAAAGFLDAVTRPDGQPFPVGDDDEGRALALGEEHEERTEATLECLGWLYGEPAWRRSAHPRARWLGLAPLESPPAARPGAGESAALRVERFAEGGYAVVAADGPPGPLRILFDAGPLGYGALAAHGHADALSLCLWAGEDLLLDAGTGSYHARAEWREALRGTRAHNTCEVDGRDQSERRGLFLWGRRAQARLMAAGGRDPWFVLAGRHDGYASRGVSEVRRSVLGHRDPGGLTLLVLDEVEGGGEHALRIPWHLGPGDPEPLAGSVEGWEVRYPGGALLRAWPVALGEPRRAELVGALGGEPPEGEGYSPRFEQWEPGACIALEVETALPAAAAWVLRAVPAGVAATGRCALERAEGGVRVELSLGGGVQLGALLAAPGAERVASGEREVSGRMAAWTERADLPAVTPPGAGVGVRGFRAGALKWSAEGPPVNGVFAPAAAPELRR